MIGLRDALGIEIFSDFFDGVVFAFALDRSHDRSERIAVGFSAGKPEFFRRP